MRRSLDALSPSVRYTRACELSAGRIIGAYSTSFGAATQLLGARHRTHVRNIYALVRIADELVDGVTAEVGMAHADQRRALEGLEAETDRAIESGYSSNPIVHAFASTARSAGIGQDLTHPFFSSMFTDLTIDGGGGDQHALSVPPLLFGDDQHASYVHGSAEVVGLMCLRVFLRHESRTAEEAQLLEYGARRLGAAFQNVNFLRDLADDTGRLGRSYLSGQGVVDTSVRDRWLSVIREQLSDGRAALPLLPRDARVAVACSVRLFGKLADRIARTPVDQLYQRRVRVSTAEKSWLVVRTAIRGGRER